MQIDPRLAFVLTGPDSKGNVPRRRRQFDAAAIEVNCALVIILLTQPQNEMFFLNQLAELPLDPAREKERLRDYRFRMAAASRAISEIRSSDRQR